MKKSYFVFLLIIITHVFLLRKILFFPYPELFIYSYLTKAGLIPYKQIFDQHFPGIMFFPINLATLGMNTPDDARLWQLGSVIMSQVLIFLIGRKLFKRNSFALLGNLLYLIWQPFFEGYVLWIETFVTPVILVSFYFFLIKNKSSIFYGSLFLGLALLFKQVLAPLVGVLAVYLFFVSKEKKNLYLFFIGVMTPVVLMCLWVLVFGIAKEFLYWTIVFNLTTFAEMGRKLPDFPSLGRAFLLFGLAVLATGISLFRIWFQNKRKEALGLLVIFFVGTLVFAIARWDYIHLQPSLPFAILILLFTLREVGWKKLIPISGFYLFTSILLLVPFYKANVDNRVLFYGDQEVNISEEIRKYAIEGESVFAFGTFPHLYQVTKTLPPGRVFVFHFPWFMVEAEESIYKGIIFDPPKVVVRDGNSEVQGMKLVKFMQKIDLYFQKYYHVVKSINGVEIMIPN